MYFDKIEISVRRRFVGKRNLKTLQIIIHGYTLAESYDNVDNVESVDVSMAIGDSYGVVPTIATTAAIRERCVSLCVHLRLLQSLLESLSDCGDKRGSLAASILRVDQLELVSWGEK